jgi:putative Holliday junction resolvase
MAIDYGKKRTGIAITDPAQIIANGLTTVPTSQLISFIQEYIKKESLERIVVGKPKQMSGKDSESATDIAGFIKNLKMVLPDIPIESYDERFTSVLAHRTMLESGLRKTARQNKALVDKISATIILQSYMESMRK